MSRKRRDQVAELQWLEDGINLLVNSALQCTKVIVLGVLQLYRQWRS